MKVKQCNNLASECVEQTTFSHETRGYIISEEPFFNHVYLVSNPNLQRLCAWWLLQYLLLITAGIEMKPVLSLLCCFHVLYFISTGCLCQMSNNDQELTCVYRQTGPQTDSISCSFLPLCYFCCTYLIVTCTTELMPTQVPCMQFIRVNLFTEKNIN